MSTHPKAIELPASDDAEKLKAAYLAVKDLDPDAIVVTAHALTDAEVADFTCSLDRCHRKGTYVLSGKCLNCGTPSYGRFSCGHEANDRSHDCPHCGVRRIYWSREAS